ncbi:MAG: hypothetical protein HY308_04925 [Gammaproteobacteria bacterium]|nr:hypothetical protein [Gammaproteobacteria bacterium]
MLTTERTHKVIRGDCLWNLAEHYYGNGSLWPMIYQHNNRKEISQRTGTRIVDPDLILIGQTLLIPPLAAKPAASQLNPIRNQVSQNRDRHSQSSVPRSTDVIRVRQRQPNPPNGGEPMARKPAGYIASPGLVFELNKHELIGKGPGYSVKATLLGRLLMQAKAPVSLPDINAKSLKHVEFKAKQDAETLYGTLTNSAKFEFDPTKRTVKFECGLTTHASNIPNAPEISVVASIDSVTGQPVLKGSVEYPMIKGVISGQYYVGESVRVEVEVTFDKKVGLTKDLIVSPNENEVWNQITDSFKGVSLGAVAVVLVVAAGTLIIVTVVEDVVTLGIGTLDDPISFAAAAGMFFGGRALWGRAAVSLSRVFRSATIAAAGLTANPAMAAPDEDLPPPSGLGIAPTFGGASR